MAKLISFCTQIKNRLHSLEQTLPVNLSENIDYKAEVEFVVADFGSTDGTFEWLASEFAAEMASGYLSYFRVRDSKGYHLSRAKNIAHRISQGRILFNLDADNFVKPSTISRLKLAFSNSVGSAIYWDWSGVYLDGSFGRVACTRDMFFAVGGYDEAMEPAGYQDRDLLLRLKAAFGLPILPVDHSIECRVFRMRKYNDHLWKHIAADYVRSIANSKEETIKHLASELDWVAMEKKNRSRSLKNLAECNWIANQASSGDSGWTVSRYEPLARLVQDQGNGCNVRQQT